MKKILILSALAISTLAAFSQSISLTDLMSVYNAPYKEVNTFLTKDKNYKAFKQTTPPEFTIYHYFMNRGKVSEEEVITGMGFEIVPGKFNTNLYYKSRDSSFVDSLQKQVTALGLKLDGEHSTSEVRSFNYSNNRIEVKFTYSTLKNYMIFFSRKH
ncbi:hypothetical protein G7074_21545 [Pedobacter sp. HDW13]|uniref:hypothetical protein n=1 Tax=unclassified Pedobacter TaxID=2628915 RepID=UPI000F5ACB81|nr:MULTISPECIES: hypothetical protein [unclassified Pedobacter]QIL41619.1 hypothetical protein G7074_21545 [Pedobacter sp. HDW13]